MALKTRHKAVLSVATIACCTALLNHWEWSGKELVVKHQSFDPAGVYTVCGGITNLDPEFANIKPGQRFTKKQCDEMLAKVIPQYLYPISKCLTHFAEYGPHKQASLGSTAYNLGPGKICNTEAKTLFNEGKDAEGCWFLTRYVRAAGRTLPGLVNRRYKDPVWGEYEWCMRTD